MRIRTKICGLTRIEDALAAAAAGADALGFNFHAQSPRHVTPERAREIVAVLPPFVTAVGLFVDATPADVERACTIAGISLVQFHGDEPAAVCAAVGLPYIKAIRVAGPIDAAALERAHPGASGFLLDAHVAGVRGGTGQRFDWAWWPAAATRPLVLAGGLDADNVGAAIATTRPYAVDVCSGVEDGRPGWKSAAKIERFMSEVRRASRGL
jgi:phosphoribosylanthranilate isomerase